MVKIGLAVALLMLLTSAAAHSPRIEFLSTLLPGLLAPDVHLTARSYPEALPNDGRSEATISVTMERDGKPLAGVEVKANVTGGDGLLRRSAAKTDEQGRATFQYRAGIMPLPGVVHVKSADGVEAEVTLPLAAVSYLDLLLVTPEEYEAHRKRQVSAAPIYNLDLSIFPTQLAADGGSPAQITAALTLVASGKPAAGIPLQAKVISGDGRVSTSQSATDASGRMSFIFNAGRQPGNASVQIIEPATGLIETASLLLVESGPARIELVCDDPLALATTHDGSMLPADGLTELPLTARVTDLTGLPLAGVQLVIEVIDDGSGRVEASEAVSNALGEVDCAYYCGTRTGKVRLRAYAAAGLPEDQ